MSADRTPDTDKDPKFDADAARQARLAAALRENLLRRKARDRAVGDASRNDNTD